MVAAFTPSPARLSLGPAEPKFQPELSCTVAAPSTSILTRRVQAVCHCIEQCRRGPVAFARRAFEAFTVYDADMTVSVFDQPGSLQNSSDDRDSRAARAE